MSVRLRIAHVAEAFEVGGLERLLVEFARHADRDRFDLRFVAMGGRGPLAAEIEAEGWPVAALGAPRGLRRSRVLLRLARLFRRHRVDVVHTHSGGPLLYATLAARLARVRGVIHTRHRGRDLQSSRRAIAACRFVSRWADRIVCVSEDGVSHGVAEGFDRGKHVTIRNGVDTAKFAGTGPRTGGPAVAVARLSPVKDLPTLIRAAALVARDDPDFRLDLAGEGPARPALEAMVAALGLADRVRFLGVVRDVPALLEGAGLMVLSSLTEGLSVTLLEGMAQGLPIVATRVGGNPEVVADGETGLLVPARSPEAVADAILRLRRDPDWAAHLGAAGRRRAESEFDVRRMVARYEDLYRDVASGARRARDSLRRPSSIDMWG